MPGWKDIQDETKAIGAPHDIVRKTYLEELSNLTERNVIAYYSGWLQIADPHGFLFCGIDDNDKNGFMATIHGLNRRKGLDLILHTPGGEMTATESLVLYLREMFGTNIRAIVPQMAMSAGTMVALSCKSIVMGKHSCIGPIDPQIGSLSAHGIIREFNRAHKEIKKDPSMGAVWVPIIAKYDPTLISECENAIDWSKQIVKRWLMSGMFRGDASAASKAEHIVEALGNPDFTKAHGRHIPMRTASRYGVKVERLEDDDDLQDAVLSAHHACIQSLSRSGAVKIIENQNGTGFIATLNDIMRSLRGVPDAQWSGGPTER